MLLIRFNPHEYKNKVKGENIPADGNIFTTGDPRDQRMANLRELIMWGLGMPSPQCTGLAPMKQGITVAFAYYDKWYNDAPGDPTQPIHYHHYKSLPSYRTDVYAASGRFKRLDKRLIFLDPTWWDTVGIVRDEEKAKTLNPFLLMPQAVRDMIREALGPAPQPVPAPPPPAPPPPPPAPAPQPPRRNPPRGQPPPAQPPAVQPPRRNPPRGARPGGGVGVRRYSV